jgi:hypothetical protein
MKKSTMINIAIVVAVGGIIIWGLTKAKQQEKKTTV